MGFTRYKDSMFIASQHAFCAEEHGHMLQVASYAELKAFLYDFASRGCGAISRSALHMSLLGKANPPGDLVGPWLPRR